MVPGGGRWRLIRQIGNGAAATCAAAVILVLCAAGHAGIPALGRVLDPGHGAWSSAAGGQLPRTRVMTLPGLRGTTLVSLDAQGIATVEASRLSDAMLALGYVHASFRLTQMDLQRRLAEGGLSQLVGAGALASDRFELQLGLLRTARREWAVMPRTGTAATMLAAYARGVNDYLAQLRACGQWPAVFSVAGVYPARWTPVVHHDAAGLRGAREFARNRADDALVSPEPFRRSAPLRSGALPISRDGAAPGRIHPGGWPNEDDDRGARGAACARSRSRRRGRKHGEPAAGSCRPGSRYYSRADPGPAVRAGGQPLGGRQCLGSERRQGRRRRDDAGRPSDRA